MNEDIFTIDQERDSLIIKVTNNSTGVIYRFEPVEVIPAGINGRTNFLLYDELGNTYLGQPSVEADDEGGIELAWAFYQSTLE